MKRLANWEPLLQEQFERARAQQFAWGEFDCALFACDCVLAITGIDPGARFRGKYTSEAEAIAFFAGKDLGAFTANVCAALGIGECPPLFARRGDVVLVDNSGLTGEDARRSTALGIVDFTGRFAWCASERGLVRVGMSRWLRAWKIGT